MTYKHFIWDFDGTLFDSYPPMVKAYHQALIEFDVDMSEEVVLKEMKVSVAHLTELCRREYHIPDDCITRFDELRSTYEQQFFKPFAGVVEVLQAVKNAGGHNYVYTHRGESTEMFLDKYSMRKFFDVVVTSNHGFARKPDPEGVQFILDQQGIEPSTALIIGDRELDILSGQNAGIKGCFYSEGPAYTCEVADYVITDFHEVLNLS